MNSNTLNEQLLLQELLHKNKQLIPNTFTNTTKQNFRLLLEILISFLKHDSKKIIELITSPDTMLFISLSNKEVSAISSFFPITETSYATIFSIASDSLLHENYLLFFAMLSLVKEKCEKKHLFCYADHAICAKQLLQLAPFSKQAVPSHLFPKTGLEMRLQKKQADSSALPEQSKDSPSSLSLLSDLLAKGKQERNIRPFFIEYKKHSPFLCAATRATILLHALLLDYCFSDACFSDILSSALITAFSSATLTNSPEELYQTALFPAFQQCMEESIDLEETRQDLFEKSERYTSDDFLIGYLHTLSNCYLLFPSEIAAKKAKSLLKNLNPSPFWQPYKEKYGKLFCK